MTETLTEATQTEPEPWLQNVVVTREFDATPEQIWAAWTTPELITQWWGPSGFRTPLEEITFEPFVGGQFKLTMYSPDNDAVPQDARVLLWEPNQRFMYTEPVPCWPVIKFVVGKMTLSEKDGKTELTLDVTSIAGVDMVEMSQGTWHEMFDKLADLLATSR
ncbi:SRPBCC family protein [Micromonospora sp. ZYX-F-536]|uniref:SRPBCC family protein n=1 Tax=Micromonospora sp. ZYX-F-536 TaxID=3457629 RepID=UPI0040407144